MNFKKSTILVAIMAIAFGSCTKNNSAYIPPYHVDGINDITINESNNSPFNAIVMNLAVNYENSNQERVTLSLEGVPAGISYAIANPTGYPTFNSNITFLDSNGAAVGSYKVNLVAKGDKSAKVTFPFYINVTTGPDYAAGFGGDYSSSNFCSTSGSYTETVTLLSPNHVRFSNFEDAGVQLAATFVGNVTNPTSGSITLPTQTVNGFIYSGNGSFQNSGGSQFIDIVYTKQPVGGGSGTTCEEFMSR